MKLHLKCSGGFAGLDLSGTLDTAELPEELARRVEEHLTPRNLRAGGGSGAAPAAALPMPDVRQYHLRLVPEDADGELETYVVDDLSEAGEVLDVIDELMAEIVRRRREEAAPESP